MYGSTTARFMPKAPKRFRLVARSITTGDLVGLFEWHVSADSGEWTPSGPPWVHWDEWVELAA
ncbi:hypothetical protein ABT095_15750 [Kitasatospora sp. NPDC002227]|uniref:hypothetical protein n=1 Tax=Kitasatospora sp. NPDC002227 TaxID=3154773 RepID=UPI0033287D6E